MLVALILIFWLYSNHWNEVTKYLQVDLPFQIRPVMMKTRMKRKRRLKRKWNQCSWRTTSGKCYWREMGEWLEIYLRKTSVSCFCNRSQFKYISVISG